MAVETQMMPVMNGHAFNGDVEMENGIRDPSLRFTSGLILPPPEIKCKVFHYIVFVVLRFVFFCSCNRQNSIVRCSLCEPASV
jgi:hypothetical protein